MVNIKVKTKFTLEQDIKRLSNRALKDIQKQSVEIILDEYNNGISPVSGYNRFAQYEESTAKRKGRRSPVTIKESGRLHRSLKAIKKGFTITLRFVGSRNERIAKFLHFGTINMNARPLLPTDGQSFKKKIIDKFNKIINNHLKKLK